MPRCLICGAEHSTCTGDTPAPQFIITMEAPDMAGPYIANRRLYLDKAGKVVEEGDPTKATLLVHAGGMVPMDRARELGLIEEKAKPEAPENKMRKHASSNKSKAE
jgi:hypothetical protein